MSGISSAHDRVISEIVLCMFVLTFDGYKTLTRRSVARLQILAHDIAGWNTRLQSMEGMVQAHLGARHEKKLSHNVLGPE